MATIIIVNNNQLHEHAQYHMADDNVLLKMRKLACGTVLPSAAFQSTLFTKDAIILESNELEIESQLYLI